MSKIVVVLCCATIQQHSATLPLRDILRRVRPEDEVVTNWPGLANLLPNVVRVERRADSLLGLCGFLWSGTHILLVFRHNPMWVQLLEAVLRMRRRYAVFVATDPSTLRRINPEEMRFE